MGTLPRNIKNMSELSQLNNAVLFTNWTNEDFEHAWNGKPFYFKARTSEWISIGDKEHNEGLARFFAKHLVDRELNKKNVPTDHFTRADFEKNCFLDLKSTQPVPVYEVEIHKETGLVAKVTEIGREDVKTGKITKTEVAEEVVEEVKEETPEPLGTETEKSTVSDEKSIDPALDKFEE